MRGATQRLEPLPYWLYRSRCCIKVPQVLMAGYMWCFGRFLLKGAGVGWSGCRWLESPQTELVRREREGAVRSLPGRVRLAPYTYTHARTYTDRGYSTSMQSTSFSHAPPEYLTSTVWGTSADLFYLCTFSARQSSSAVAPSISSRCPAHSFWITENNKKLSIWWNFG